MAYRSLRDFIDMLEAEGELVRVSEPVSTHLEMTEIQTRLLRNGGPAVIFEKPVMPDGSISPIPCLANLFGTVKRVAMGVTLEKKSRTTAAELREVGELLAFLRNPTPPRGLSDAMEMLPLAQTVMSMRPKVVKSAPVQEVVLKGDQIDLTSLNGDGAGTAIFQACQVFGGQQVPCAVQDSGRIPDALDKRLQWRGVERQEQ
jgi:4-hydroxy-3-polyprenylbenzoate decarboxylase